MNENDGPSRLPARLPTLSSLDAAVAAALERSGYQLSAPGAPREPPAQGDDRDPASLLRSIRSMCEDSGPPPWHLYWIQKHPNDEHAGGRERGRVVACSVLSSIEECARQLVADTEAVRSIAETLGFRVAGRERLSGDGDSRQVFAFSIHATDGSRMRIATLTDYGEEPGRAAGPRGRGRPIGAVRLTVLRIDTAALNADLRARYAAAAAAASLGDCQEWTLPETPDAHVTERRVEGWIRNLLAGPYRLHPDAVNAACAELSRLIAQPGRLAWVGVVRVVPDQGPVLVYLAVTIQADRAVAARTDIAIIRANVLRRDGGR